MTLKMIFNTLNKKINAGRKTAKNYLQLSTGAIFEGGFEKLRRISWKSINICFNSGTLGDSPFCQENQGGLVSVSMVGRVNQIFEYCVPI